MSRSLRSSSPPPTQEQAEKLKLAQKAIKKRNKKPDFLSTYKNHIITSVLISFIIVTVLAFRKEPDDLNVIVEKEINTHNSLDYPYKLGPNLFFRNYTTIDAKSLFRNTFTYGWNTTSCSTQDVQLPKFYNFRTAYPDCAHPVYDQGNCSSSYLIATISAFSDRNCKLFGTPQLAVQNALSCDYKQNLGCKGGQLTRTADFLINHGVTEASCHPYKAKESFEDCNATLASCTRHRASSYCKLSNKEEIKKDIYTHGPVALLITVYKDFLTYKEGVYQVLEGTPRYPGQHAIKVIGWGEENGYPYWIIENSFGPTWGENGYGKVAMDGFLDFSEHAISVRLG